MPDGFGAQQSGADYIVVWNHPDQSSGSGFGADEFEIRNHLVTRLQGLLNGTHSATLTTFTGSGNNSGLGLLLYEMDEAMGRGALVRFIADSDVDSSAARNNNVDFTPRSLDDLIAAYPVNFTYVEDDSPSGIHHNKFALFDYGGAGNQYVFTSSANLTGGAPTFQWNIGVDIKSDALYAAYDLEADELEAGNFHHHVAKSHAHDETSFTFDGSSNHEVRFVPPPGANNPESDIVAMINNADSYQYTGCIDCCRRPWCDNIWITSCFGPDGCIPDCL